MGPQHCTVTKHNTKSLGLKGLAGEIITGCKHVQKAWQEPSSTQKQFWFLKMQNLTLLALLIVIRSLKALFLSRFKALLFCLRMFFCSAIQVGAIFCSVPVRIRVLFFSSSFMVQYMCKHKKLTKLRIDDMRQERFLSHLSLLQSR